MENLNTKCDKIELDLEEKEFRKILEMIKDDVHNNNNVNKIVTPLFLILDDLLDSLGSCGVQNTHTYFLTANTKDVNYKITLEFDPKYTNIFAKKDITNAIQSIKLEAIRKTSI